MVRSTSLRALCVLGFLRRAHAQVVLTTWRHPPEKRRPGTLAPTIGLTPALEPPDTPGLGGASEDRSGDVQPDEREERLAHAAILVAGPRRAAQATSI